jgi:hypothetical protein
MGLFNVDWSSVDVTNVGVQEAMVNAVSGCHVSTEQTIHKVRIVIYRSTAGDINVMQNGLQVDINCAVTNQINILTSQLWAVKNSSDAAQALLSAGNINIAKITDYNEFSSKIMESIHNQFTFDLSQKINDVYIGVDSSKVGNIQLTQSGVQQDITAVFNNVSEAVAALDANISNAATAGKTSLTWLTWVLLAIVVVMGIVAVSYTVYKNRDKFKKTGTKAKSWFKSKTAKVRVQ